MIAAIGLALGKKLLGGAWGLLSDRTFWIVALVIAAFFYGRHVERAEGMTGAVMIQNADLREALAASQRLAAGVAADRAELQTRLATTTRSRDELLAQVTTGGACLLSPERLRDIIARLPLRR